MTADFDIDRLADKVKNARIKEVDPHNLSDEHLSKFFSPTTLGVIDDPATVVDEHGRVILWFLPDIMAPFRVVSEFLVHLLIFA